MFSVRSQSATLIDGHLAKKYRPTFCYVAYRGLFPELDLGDASDVRVCRNDRCSLDKDNRPLFRCEPGRRWNYSDSVRYGRLGSGNAVMGLGLQVALLHGSRTDRYLLFHVNGTMGLASGKWAYTANMIVVPVLNVGLWPFLQLMLLVPLAIWIAALISRRFDEPLTSK